MPKHNGGCHCGAVRFEIEAAADIEVHECNCSICGMFGFRHLIVPADNFRLISGDAALSCYTFNSEIAKHYFCSRCGVKSFYIPRSNPDGVSINARCLDEGTMNSITVLPFDGKNWEANADSLSHLSSN